MYVSKLGALLCVSLLSALLGMGQADAQGLLERFVDGLDAATGAGANDAARSAAGNAVRSFGSITPDATSTYQQRMIDDAVRATGSGNGHSQRSTGSGGGANAAAPSRNTGPRVRSIPNLDAYNAHCIGGVSDAQWAECDRFNQRDAAQRRQERLQREEAAARAEQRRQRAEESRAREQAAQQLQRERAAQRERERQARQRQAELERNPSYVYGQMVRNARAASVAYFDARQIPFTPLVALVLGLVMLVAPNARLVIISVLFLAWLQAPALRALSGGNDFALASLLSIASIAWLAALFSGRLCYIFFWWILGVFAVVFLETALIKLYWMSGSGAQFAWLGDRWYLAVAAATALAIVTADHRAAITSTVLRFLGALLVTFTIVHTLDPRSGYGLFSYLVDISWLPFVLLAQVGTIEVLSLPQAPRADLFMVLSVVLLISLFALGSALERRWHLTSENAGQSAGSNTETYSAPDTAAGSAWKPVPRLSQLWFKSARRVAWVLPLIGLLAPFAAIGSNPSLAMAPLTRLASTDARTVVSIVEQEEMEWEEGHRTVSAQTLNVRAGPSTDFDVVDQLQHGAVVYMEVEDPETGWAKIGDGRWVSTAYLH